MFDKVSLDLDTAKEIIYNNNDMTGLIKDLNEEGYKFPNKKRGFKKGYKEALRYWIEIREEEFPLNSIPKARPGLPQTIVEKDDKKYHLIGVVHGANSIFRDFYKSHISEINSNGNEVYAEDAFSINYSPSPFSKIQEFSDDDVLTIGDSLKVLRIRFIDYNFHKLISKIPGDPIRENTKEQLQLLKEIDPEDSEADKEILTLRELSKRSLLPEPIHSDYIRKLNSGFYLRAYNKRGELMAEKLSWAGSEDVYGFMGQAHEMQVEYFLESNFGELGIYPDELDYIRYENS